LGGQTVLVEKTTGTILIQIHAVEGLLIEERGRGGGKQAAGRAGGRKDIAEALFGGNK
jgi:hypothetical protein